MHLDALAILFRRAATAALLLALTGAPAPSGAEPPSPDAAPAPAAAESTTAPATNGASPSPPAPSTATASVDVSGRWQGAIASTGAGSLENILTTISLRQSGPRLDGNIELREHDTYAQFRLVGKVDGRSITFQATETMSNQLRFCFPSVALQYRVEKGRAYLLGRILPNVTAKGCTPLAPATINLQRRAAR
jgi:hypothetical protein